MKPTGLTGQIGTLLTVLLWALTITMASIFLYSACTPDSEGPKPIKPPPPQTPMDIYLCFGQSNMEGYVSGGGIPEEDKQDVSDRFQVLAAVDMPALGRTQGEWYTAVPPLCRGDTGLTPADYFGRAMVEGSSDSDVRVGVIVVAVAGCAINLFDKDTNASSSYLNAQQDWMKNIAAQYDNNPYQHLVDMARIAQESGVIRGICCIRVSRARPVQAVQMAVITQTGLRR